MNLTWLKAALIRAVKTMAQTAVSLMGTGAAGILDVNWVAIASASALAGVLSLLTSVAGLPEVDLQDTLDEYDEYESSMHDEDEDEDEDDEEEGEE